MDVVLPGIDLDFQLFSTVCSANESRNALRVPAAIAA